MISRNLFVVASVCVFSAVLVVVPFGAAEASRGPSPCTPPEDHPSLGVRDGHLDFIRAERLQPLLDVLPEVESAQVTEILRSENTIWYDEESMIFVYQDSIESVVGGRANCVGRVVGERNRNHPGISRLLHYFGPDYRFRFPFRTVAGTDEVDNIISLNFWHPPRVDGKVLPVKWWQQSRRGRWNWVFPVGTVFGEILYQKDSAGQWHVFEIRTRSRYRDGWSVDMFRPFTSAASLAAEVKKRRPAWQSDSSLRNFVEHLQSPETLAAHQLVSPAFGKIFPPIDGALDVLPDPKDEALIVELLRGTRFKSVEGRIWKENGPLETYGPGSSVDFSIVPKGYTMGMIPVNEVSCNRCHSETGRRLGDMETNVILYGEVWGEDRIFTWHLFRPHQRIFGTWDDADGSRQVNPKMVRAGLLKQERPSANDPYYKQLPGVFNR